MLHDWSSVVHMIGVTDTSIILEGSKMVRGAK